MACWRLPATKLLNMLSAYAHYFTIFETNQPPICYTRCCSFVAPSLSPWVGKVLPLCDWPWFGLACGCVLAFLRWPCIGWVLAVVQLVRWPCFGRSGRASVGVGRVEPGPGPCIVGAKPSGVGRKEPHTSGTFNKFKNYDKSLPAMN